MQRGNAPFRTAEAEAVRQLALQRIPILLLLLLWQLQQGVVVFLEPRVLLDDDAKVAPAAILRSAATATAAAAASILALKDSICQRDPIEATLIAWQGCQVLRTLNFLPIAAIRIGAGCGCFAVWKISWSPPLKMTGMYRHR